MHTPVQQAADRIAKLIADGEAILMSSKTATPQARARVGGAQQVERGGVPKVNEVAYAAWRPRAEAALVDIFGETHSYTKAFQKNPAWAETKYVRLSVGILQGVAQAIANGELNAFARDVVANVFADMLEMAEHMFTAPGYQPAAAAMLCGAVLENTLKRLCDARGIPRNRDGIDGSNIKLHADGAYNAFMRDSITAWRRPRNDADHGDFDQVQAIDVRSMLDGVRKFVGDHASVLAGTP